MSAGSYGNTLTFNPNAQSVGFAGDFNVYDLPFYGTPEIYKFWEPLGVDAVGTSIQVEISNDNIGERFAFDEFGYDKKDLYMVKRVQNAY